MCNGKNILHVHFLCDKLVWDGREELGSVVLGANNVGTNGLLGLEKKEKRNVGYKLTTIIGPWGTSKISERKAWTFRSRILKKTLSHDRTRD